MQFYEDKNITTGAHFPSGVKWDTFDWSEYHRDEVNVLQPQLEQLGYAEIKWSMGERDSFGPLSRVCTCIDPDGNRRQFIYG